MKCNEVQKTKTHRHTNLDNIDKALHDLGMLSAITEARHDYLRESKSNFSVMRLNTRYVSNVTVGYWMKRTTNKNRLCPYVLPVRHRTKSENSDVINSDTNENSCDVKYGLLEPSTSGFNRDTVEEKCLGKRCQSLENLNLSVPQTGLEISPDMDCVSTQIQNLQVNE